MCHILPARQDNTNSETDESPSVCRILTHVLSVAVVRNQSVRGSASSVTHFVPNFTCKFLVTFLDSVPSAGACLCHSGMHLSTGQPEEAISPGLLVSQVLTKCVES